jgi:DNA-binding transcriptional regulator of glucitol operon
MNMLVFTLVFAGLWIAQMVLSYWQAKRFMSDVSTLRRSGVVYIGRGKRRGLRTYVALALRDGVVTDSLILNGYTVFARAKAKSELVGKRVDEVIEGAVPGLDGRTAAAAAHAATLSTKRPSRKPKAVAR